MDNSLTVEIAPGLTASLWLDGIDFLLKAAKEGFRLYELFQLTGPEELMEYVRINVTAQENAQRPDWWPDVWWDEQGWPQLRSGQFSSPPWRYYYSQRNDPDPAAWTASGLGLKAPELAREWWPAILVMRDAARASTDTLVQAELALIDEGQHPNDRARLEPNASDNLVSHFNWYPIREFPEMVYGLLSDLLAHPDIKGFAHRGDGDWFAIKLACAEQIRREGRMLFEESKLFPISLLTAWSGNSMFDYDDGHRMELSPYPAWTEGVRFQSEGLHRRNGCLFLDTGGFGAKPMAMNEHEQFDQLDKRIPVLLTLSECLHPENHRVWYQHECGILAGVLPGMVEMFDVLLREHRMTL